MIRERSPNIVAANQQQDRPLQAMWRNRNTNVHMSGRAPNFLKVRGFRMAVGRMFGEAENVARGKVAVIGVMARKGQTGFGDRDEQILPPFETGLTRAAEGRSFFEKIYSQLVV